MAKDKQSIEYQCLKCKLKIYLTKRLEFCVCGGKLYIVDEAQKLLEKVFDAMGFGPLG